MTTYKTAAAKTTQKTAAEQTISLADVEKLLAEALAAHAPAAPAPADAATAQAEAIAQAVAAMNRTPVEADKAAQVREDARFELLQKQLQELQSQRTVSAQAKEMQDLQMIAALQKARAEAGRSPAVAELLSSENGISIHLDVGRVVMYAAIGVAVLITAYGTILLVREGVKWVAAQWGV